MFTPPTCGHVRCYMAYVDWLAGYAVVAHYIMMGIRFNAAYVAAAMRRSSDQLDA